MRHVIIGNSAAGVNAAEQIRMADPNAVITIISEEKDLAYSRCLISRYLDQRLKEEGLYFKSKNFYRDFQVELILNTRVDAINRGGKMVHLSTGKEVSYDKLLIAVGSRPARPKINGLDKTGVSNFYSFEDVRRINAQIMGAKKAVVVGGGFAGLEAAYALRQRGLGVTVIERCQQILPQQFDLVSSQLIQEDLESLGIEVILNESVAAINGADKVESIALARGDIDCSLSIFCTGMQPNAELAQDAELKKDRGIVVDEYLRTSDENIFSAGDCIEIEDVTSGKRQLSATWFNAVLQGKYAGMNMAGGARRYAGSVGIQNAVQLHRLSAISFGVTQVPEDDLDYQVINIHNREKKVYRKLVLKDNILHGMIFVGDIMKAGFYAALIRNKVDLGSYKNKLFDPDFSHAFFKKENFLQLSPYNTTPESWQNPSWFAERVSYMRS